MHPFPKAARIRKTIEFNQLRTGAPSIGNRYFQMRWMPKENRRIGIIVSSKVGRAYKRNAIKRVVREYFRLNREAFPKGDVVVIARNPLGLLEKSLVRKALRDLLERIH